MCGDCGDHLVMYTDIKSWCCTPETNIILHVNYTSILKMNLKKKKKRKQVQNSTKNLMTL